jgi:hypothetical protein
VKASDFLSKKKFPTLADSHKIVHLIAILNTMNNLYRQKNMKLAKEVRATTMKDPLTVVDELVFFPPLLLLLPSTEAPLVSLVSAEEGVWPCL